MITGYVNRKHTSYREYLLWHYYELHASVTELRQRSKQKHMQAIASRVAEQDSYYYTSLALMQIIVRTSGTGTSDFYTITGVSVGCE